MLLQAILIGLVAALGVLGIKWVLFISTVQSS